LPRCQGSASSRAGCSFRCIAVSLNEQQIMLIVLGLIDVVMISNLLMMVIVGGYETFVSRMRLEKHPDQPEWLRRAGTLSPLDEVAAPGRRVLANYFSRKGWPAIPQGGREPIGEPRVYGRS
jgi:hypothetical protein